MFSGFEIFLKMKFKHKCSNVFRIWNTFKDEIQTWTQILSGFEIFLKIKFKNTQKCFQDLKYFQRWNSNTNKNIVRVHLPQRFQEHPKPDRRGDQEPVGRNQGGLWWRMSEEVEEDRPEKSSRGEEAISKKTNVINIGDPNSSVVQN